MFTFQKISDYGTSTPAVARTFAQGLDFLPWICQSASERQALTVILHEWQRQLLSCVEIRDNLRKDIAVAQSDGVVFQHSKAASIPGISNLRSRVEGFFHSAKLAIDATGNLLGPSYQIHFGHKYHKICKWADEQFGTTDQFTVALYSWQPFVAKVVQMRNCIDHPKTEPGAPLVVKDFSLEKTSSGELVLIEPSCALTGEDLWPILHVFDSCIDAIIRLGENVLVGLLKKRKQKLPVQVEEIPEGERDPKNPKRFRIIFRP